MGLSVTATYGILFTASLFMMGMLLNGLLYSYDQFKTGLNDKINVLEDKKNIITIDRIVLNGTQIELRALNKGPNTLNTTSISILVNGTVVNFSAAQVIWYPGDYDEFFINHTYDFGVLHSQSFELFFGGNPIATAEMDKIYILNSTGVYSYYYSGALAWTMNVVGPRDISVSSQVYILNTTGIEILDYDGSVTSFLSGYNFSAIASRGSIIYGVNTTALTILNVSSNSVIKSVSLSDGRDVAVGKYVFVLDGDAVKYYDYNGTYVGSITGSEIFNAKKITADTEISGDYLLLLNGDGSILVFKNENLIATITPPMPTNNIDLHGKIYLSGSSVVSLDSGYRIKMIDGFGNEVYQYL